MTFVRKEFTPLPVRGGGHGTPKPRIGYFTDSGRWIVTKSGFDGWRVMHRSGFSIVAPFQWSLPRSKDVALVCEGVLTPTLDAIDVTSQEAARNHAKTLGADELALLRQAILDAGMLP